MSVHDELPSPAAGLLRLARQKAGITQAELAARAGVPASMVSAYERDRRQPTLATLVRLVRAAGFDLRFQLAPHDDHDELLAEALAAWPAAEQERWEREQRQRLERQPATGRRRRQPAGE
ncbi:MAG: helix-turn-helix domain-containing protein [Acidimicrobiia bacterium]